MKASLQRGFTLIELVVVVAVIGIISAVALPAYLDAVRESHRTDAEMTMQRIAMSLERFYTTYGKLMDATGETYDLDTNFGNRCVPKVEGCNATHSGIRYYIDFEQLTATSYKIRATPKNDQLNDICGVLTIDDTNTKTFSGAEGDSVECSGVQA